MKNTIPLENQRIKILREYLHLSQIEFANELGRKQGSISDIERGRNTIDGIVQLLEIKFNVNIDWLKNGVGDMFNSNILQEPEAEYTKANMPSSAVPIYDVEFAAGVMTKLIDSKEDHYPVGYLSIPEVLGCDAIVRARGDSMADRIKDRDWIGIKRVNNWQEWFPMNNIYAIITDDFELVKYIKKGDDTNTFKIVSHNKDYPDDEIPKHVIRELWSVRAIIPGKIETLI